MRADIVTFVMWTIPSELETQMKEHCSEGFPLESCGLFLGPLDGEGKPVGVITHLWPAHNSEKSARIYSVDPKDMFEASRFAQDNKIDIVGVYHSHTHSLAYPSPTDIEQAIDSNWCYAIASLAAKVIDVHYFSIENDEATELECTRL
ncbi:MAG TPA: M67 family metallopeptidase [Acidimicrobiia bacterium]|nr:M67 family metallopeptidase [Acidimicrobiia bacterium]